MPTGSGPSSDKTSYQVQASVGVLPNLSNLLCQGKAESLSLASVSHDIAGATSSAVVWSPRIVMSLSQQQCAAGWKPEDWLREAAQIPICSDYHDDQSDRKLLFSKCEHNSDSGWHTARFKILVQLCDEGFDEVCMIITLIFSVMPLSWIDYMQVCINLFIFKRLSFL